MKFNLVACVAAFTLLSPFAASATELSADPTDIMLAQAGPARPKLIEDRGESCSQEDERIRRLQDLSKCPVDAKRNVVIGGSPACMAVEVDRDFTTANGNAFGKIEIKAGGSLTMRDITRTLEAAQIIVGGTFQAGSESCPVGTLNAGNKVTVRLLGTRTAPAATAVDHAAMAHAAMGHAAPAAGPKAGPGDTCTDVPKGIGVMSGGRMRLFGARGLSPADRDTSAIGGPNLGTASWTFLTRPAGPRKYQTSADKIGIPVPTRGEFELIVAANVFDNWQRGDWIVVGTTSFSPYETEFVKIDKVEKGVAGTTKITLDPKTPLRHYHFGSPDPGWPSKANFDADKELNYGVDERAEVGLVSRSIVLTAKMPNAETAPVDEKSLAWGGETRFCAGFAEAKMEGVEIDRFGKDQLGSYPIHMHMAGDVPAGAALINANSIHHSYNKCVTVHMTNDVKFSNNVCARIVGHIFYDEKRKDPATNTGDQNIENKNIKYHNNLGLGAMANGFGIDPAKPKVETADKKKVFVGWWEGDYLSRVGDGYYGRDIPNTDDRTLAVTGSCFNKLANGSLEGNVPPPCPVGTYYFEPPSGFWTSNPGTEMIGNSIGGCQSIGKAYWFVPPKLSNGLRVQMANQPVGRNVNNRAHACYDGVFGENDTGVSSEQLFPTLGSDFTANNLFARFDGFTATRIRNRGVWMRPTWFVFEHARVATSREGVSLLTSGGVEGNSPGVWGLLKNSVIVGVSMNNVDRWGPCAANMLASGLQESPGCVDWNPLSTTIYEKGYPTPAWNFAGFYIYDGPARIHDVRFVNFRKDPMKRLLTEDDITTQKAFTKYFNNAGVYEGDAALGWFQSNQSAYPVATEVRGLTWDGVDLRHQVFTELVNFAKFDDGDKNTAIVDRDGSLTGFKVVDAKGKEGPGTTAHDQYPISLNNLPFNASSNAVDECLAEGAQDEKFEGRPTSLISPGNMATLEFEAFSLPDGVVPPLPVGNQPPRRLTQLVTFTKDMTDFDKHHSMTLHSRNNQGIWEPKVTSGLGYTATAAAGGPVTDPITTRDPGFPRYVSVGLVDVVKPGITKANPFVVRVGVCFTNKDGTYPDAVDKFEIKRGYRSWGGGPLDYNNAAIKPFYNKLDLAYEDQRCFNLAAAEPSILNDAVKGCPAHGITPRDANNGCPPGAEATTGRNNLPVCAFAPTVMTSAPAITDITNANGTPKDTDKYYYDKTTGMLFFYAKQDRPNAIGTSPLGSCTNGKTDPACPNPADTTFPESYYTCPPEGCVSYSVRMSPTVPYDPGASACATPLSKPDVQDIYKVKDAAGQSKYAQAPSATANKLAFKVPPPGVPANGIVEAIANPGEKGFPHYEAGYNNVKVKPVCTGLPTGGLAAGFTGSPN